MIQTYTQSNPLNVTIDWRDRKGNTFSDTLSILFHQLYLRQWIVSLQCDFLFLEPLFLTFFLLQPQQSTQSQTHTCCSLFLSLNSQFCSHQLPSKEEELVYMYTPLHPHLVIQTNRCGESFKMRPFEYRHPFIDVFGRRRAKSSETTSFVESNPNVKERHIRHTCY